MNAATTAATTPAHVVTSADISYNGQRIELENGWYAIVRTEWDDSMAEPWKEHDGHGKVSEWRTYKWRDGRGKRAGERTLCMDGYSARFYDFAGAVETARKDEWGCNHIITDDHGATIISYGHATKGELAACAAQQDFDRLRAWCNDYWQWIGVVVTIYDADGTKVEQDSVWGIESDGDYWKDVAAELLTGMAGGVCMPAEGSMS